MSKYAYVKKVPGVLIIDDLVKDGNKFVMAVSARFDLIEDGYDERMVENSTGLKNCLAAGHLLYAGEPDEVVIETPAVEAVDLKDYIEVIKEAETVVVEKKDDSMDTIHTEEVVKEIKSAEHYENVEKVEVLIPERNKEIDEVSFELKDVDDSLRVDTDELNLEKHFEIISDDNEARIAEISKAVIRGNISEKPEEDNTIKLGDKLIVDKETNLLVKVEPEPNEPYAVPVDNTINTVEPILLNEEESIEGVVFDESSMNTIHEDSKPNGVELIEDYSKEEKTEIEIGTVKRSDVPDTVSFETKEESVVKNEGVSEGVNEVVNVTEPIITNKEVKETKASEIVLEKDEEAEEIEAKEEVKEVVAVAVDKDDVGEQLIAKGWIDRDQLNAALRVQRNNGDKLIDVLFKLGFVTTDTIMNILSKEEKKEVKEEVKKSKKKVKATASK